MVPRENRLTRGHFKTQTKSTRLASEHFSLSYQPAMSFRMAVVVSKKVAAKATERNALKRRAYDVGGNNPPPNGTYTLYARAGAPTLSYKELESEILSLFKKAKTI